MEKISATTTIDLIVAIDKQLLKLLKNLSIEEWAYQTIAPKWKVKDVAVHLLDGNLRTLSMLRDNFFAESSDEINSYSDLVQFLNKLNADWVQGMKRLSPRVIIDLLESSGKEYCDFLHSLNPNDKSAFSVAWAGEMESQNWFHIAREYTEKWHHQQQIRLAVGKDAELLKEEWYYLYLDTSVRALPHHYRAIKGSKKDLIKFVFRGKKDKVWFLKWEIDKWELIKTTHLNPNCEVIIKDQIAWRIFTKGIQQQDAIKQSEIIGNPHLGTRIFDMIAVMA